MKLKKMYRTNSLIFHQYLSSSEHFPEVRKFAQNISIMFTVSSILIYKID